MRERRKIDRVNLFYCEYCDILTLSDRRSSLLYSLLLPLLPLSSFLPHLTSKSLYVGCWLEVHYRKQNKEQNTACIHTKRQWDREYENEYESKSKYENYELRTTNTQSVNNIDRKSCSCSFFFTLRSPCTCNRCFLANFQASTLAPSINFLLSLFLSPHIFSFLCFPCLYLLLSIDSELRTHSTFSSSPPLLDPSHVTPTSDKETKYLTNTMTRTTPDSRDLESRISRIELAEEGRNILQPPLTYWIWMKVRNHHNISTNRNTHTIHMYTQTL